MNKAAKSLAKSVATSRISTTKTSHTPKAILFCRNNFSTLAGSLTTTRAIAESVDSETLMATTSQLCAFSNFTTSSIAPTLFAKKTENCFTNGPSRFEVVLGKSSGIKSIVLSGLNAQPQGKQLASDHGTLTGSATGLDGSGHS